MSAGPSRKVSRWLPSAKQVYNEPTGASQRVVCHLSENETTIQLDEVPWAVRLPTMQLTNAAGNGAGRCPSPQGNCEDGATRCLL
jgi:hypothetical protein